MSETSPSQIAPAVQPRTDLTMFRTPLSLKESQGSAMLLALRTRHFMRFGVPFVSLSKVFHLSTRPDPQVDAAELARISKLNSQRHCQVKPVTKNKTGIKKKKITFNSLVEEVEREISEAKFNKKSSKKPKPISLQHLGTVISTLSSSAKKFHSKSKKSTPKTLPLSGEDASDSLQKTPSSRKNNLSPLTMKRAVKTKHFNEFCKTLRFTLANNKPLKMSTTTPRELEIEGDAPANMDIDSPPSPTARVTRTKTPALQFVDSTPSRITKRVFRGRPPGGNAVRIGPEVTESRDIMKLLPNILVAALRPYVPLIKDTVTSLSASRSPMQKI